MKKKYKFLITFTIIIISLLSYSRWIEPLWIEVTRHTIFISHGRSMKIILLSDLHTYEFGAREKKVLKIIHQEKPDVILISGDTVSNQGDWKSVNMLLSQLKAPLGVFLVRGNWEHWRPSLEELKIYENSGVTFLNNQSYSFSNEMWLVGLDDSLGGVPDEKTAFTNVPQNVFTIAVFHSPEYFDLIHSRVDLAFTGHTHGGQIRIPFLPPLWLPQGSGKYVEGWYTQNSRKMYVSRGVGNSILEMRFACRPEIAIFQLQKLEN